MSQDPKAVQKRQVTANVIQTQLGGVETGVIKLMDLGEVPSVEYVSAEARLDLDADERIVGITWIRPLGPAKAERKGA